MELIINGHRTVIENREKVTLKEILKSYDKTYDVMIVNGYPGGIDKDIKDGDEIVLIKKGEIPKESELETLMISRHTPKVHDAFKKARVAIAGLGGLGSNIASSLARVGIGEMLLVDFDVVEPSNLNRQAYFVEDLGQTKTSALIQSLERINPYNTYEGLCKKVIKGEVVEIFDGYDVVVEAFDNPEYKSILVNELLSNTDIPIVSASGLAGLYSPNSIKSKNILKNLYLVGDGIHEAKEFEGLMAPRVMIAAGHQATLVCQILLNKVELGEDKCLS